MINIRCIILYTYSYMFLICLAVASTKETTLIGRISDVVRPERGTDFVA